MSTSEKYISNTPLKDKPRYPTKLSLKDNCITTKKLADNSVTADKLSQEVRDALDKADMPNGKGLVAMLSYFSMEDTNDPNVGDVNTFLIKNGKLLYKEGEKETDNGVVGVYSESVPTKEDLFVDCSTGDTYRWDGEKMVVSMVPLSIEEIDEIISGINNQAKKAVRMIAPMAAPKPQPKPATSIQVVNLVN